MSNVKEKKFMNYQDIFFEISIIHIGHRTLAKDPINPKIQ